MKIGIVLSHPPKISETFLLTFIKVISETHDVVLFLSKRNTKIKKTKQLVYLKPKNFWILPQYLIKFLLTIPRFRNLKGNSSLKLLIHDIPIWSIKELDYLHFTFGNLAIGRENYASEINCKMSVSFRGSDINVYPIRHNFSYFEILSNCHKIHCNSEQLKRELEKHNPAIDNKVVVIPPGLQEGYYITVDQLDDFNKRRFINDKFIMVTIGRLHWIKGFEKTLEALSELKKLNIDFEYNIIGSGPEEEKLKFLCSFYNITTSVNFLGSKTEQDIKKLLEISNCYIQTSWAEGFSNATMEALALGLPAIVTPISGMSELIMNRKNGFIVDLHDSKSILSGLLWYINLTTEEKLEKSYNAYRKIFDNFTQKELLKNWNNFYLN